MRLGSELDKDLEDLIERGDVEYNEENE